jgi:hypothetical protein
MAKIGVCAEYGVVRNHKFIFQPLMVFVVAVPLHYVVTLTALEPVRMFN